MDDSQKMISGYLDDELSREETASLEAALKSSPGDVDRFVMSNFIHCQLLEWLSEPALPGTAVATGRQSRLDLSDSFNGYGDKIPTTLSDSAELGNSIRPRSKQRPHRSPSWMAITAAVMVAACIGIVGYVIQSRPVLVATLTDVTNCKWSAKTTQLGAGAFLEEGQELELVEGQAVITFATGAKLWLEAPATVEMESNNQVRLMSGRVAAKVPRQAVGFTVTSSLARFVDLGTAFTVSLRPEDSFKLHVFEGLVEVQLDPKYVKAANPPAHIAEVRAVTFDTKSGDIELLPFQDGLQMPF
jgi:hypothetical protein